MIQELFGGAGAAGLLNRDRNQLPISGHHVFDQASPSPSPSPSPSSSTTTTTTTATTSVDVQKLRCPRCDSSNTKFCYYNNYNLTQPRHFCKTCRRYWTKGGALRNVPIGGGCRKNKGGGTTIATAVGKPISANGKLKAVVSSELIGKTGFINGFEVPEFNSNNPILWSAPPPQSTSHLLSLLRASTIQNPNPNFGSTHNNIKDQGFMVGSNMGNLGYEPLAAQASLSLWRNNQQQNHHHQVQQQNHQGGGGMMSSGLRSSSDHAAAANNLFYHHNDHQAAITPNLILGGINVANTTSSSLTTSTTTAILDSAPVLANGELGFWNQTLPWSDLAAANGAYP